MAGDLPLDPADFIPRFDLAARRGGFRAQTYGEINGHPLNAYTKRTAGVRPRIYISTGMHGDEPAPPCALLRLLESGFFDERCTWFICPMLNPTGFALRTRENFPVSVALKGFIDAQSSSNYGAMFAMSVVSLIPLFLAFLIGQRYLVKGIATTGIK